MAAPEPKARVDTLEDTKDVLNTRRSELEAVHGHLGGRSLGTKGAAAKAKMQGYREGHKAMTQYNQAMVRKFFLTTIRSLGGFVKCTNSTLQNFFTILEI